MGAGCKTLLETLTGVCSTLRLLGAFTLDGIGEIIHNELRMCEV